MKAGIAIEIYRFLTVAFGYLVDLLKNQLLFDIGSPGNYLAEFGQHLIEFGTVADVACSVVNSLRPHIRNDRLKHRVDIL